MRESRSPRGLARSSLACSTKFAGLARVRRLQYAIRAEFSYILQATNAQEISISKCAPRAFTALTSRNHMQIVLWPSSIWQIHHSLIPSNEYRADYNCAPSTSWFAHAMYMVQCGSKIASFPKVLGWSSYSNVYSCNWSSDKGLSESAHTVSCN